MREQNRTMSAYYVARIDRRRRSEANCIFRLWLFGRVFSRFFFRFRFSVIRSLDSIVHKSQANAIGRNWRKNWRHRLIGCLEGIGIDRYSEQQSQSRILCFLFVRINFHGQKISWNFEFISISTCRKYGNLAPHSMHDPRLDARISRADTLSKIQHVMRAQVVQIG